MRDYASDSGKLTLLDVLASSEESDFVAFARGGTTLEELCDKAHRNGEMLAPSFDAIDAEEFTNQKAPRPPGYCAQTRLRFGEVDVTSLLDYGATCNAMPEEIALAIISQGLKSYTDHAHRDYPVVSLHSYRSTREMDGVVAGKPLVIKYGIVLRAQFVGVGAETGPTRDLYFNVLPKGTCFISVSYTHLTLPTKA